MLSYHMTLRSEFRVVMSTTISAWNDVRIVFTSSCLYEGSCLIYVICVCLRMLVSHKYWLLEKYGGYLVTGRDCLLFVWVRPRLSVGPVLLLCLVFCFVCLRRVSCVPNVSLDCLFVIVPSFSLTFIFHNHNCKRQLNYI